jgi:hypothetical protein
MKLADGGTVWLALFGSSIHRLLFDALQHTRSGGFLVRVNLQTGFGLADFVLVHVDTEQGHDQIVNLRLAYVSASRGRHDAQIYTDDAGKLGEKLSRDISN